VQNNNGFKFGNKIANINIKLHFIHNLIGENKKKRKNHIKDYSTQHHVDIQAT